MTEIDSNSAAYAIAICNNLPTDAHKFTDQEIMEAIDIVLHYTKQYAPRKVLVNICNYLISKRRNDPEWEKQ